MDVNFVLGAFNDVGESIVAHTTARGIYSPVALIFQMLPPIILVVEVIFTAVALKLGRLVEESSAMLIPGMYPVELLQAGTTGKTHGHSSLR